MALHKLSDARVRNAKTPGMLPDGGGLRDTKGGARTR